MRRARRAARLVAGAALALLAASCGRAPAPRPAQPPPVRPAAPAPSLPNDDMRIRISLAVDVDSLTLVPVRPVSVMEWHSSDMGYSLADGTMAPLSFRMDSAGFSMLAGSDTTRLPLVAAGTDTIAVGIPIGTSTDLVNGRPTGPDPSIATWAGKHWRGIFKIFVNPRGRLTLATNVRLETYLLGVVPLEIGGLRNELLEAGRAQAIAARSYTLFYRGRRASEGFDLYGTVEDQVYGPVEAERPLASRCVESTRGEVALDQGQPIRANYCSTCGGVTAAVWEAWPVAPVPYLVSHRDAAGGADFCAGSPQYRWTERWSADEFLADLARFAPAQGLRLPAAGPGALIDVRADARSISGRVWRLRVRTTTMDLAIPAYAIRGVLRRGGQPGSILRSDLFKIDVRRDPASGRALEVLASGAGAGHGVGLCQTGALGMARAGANAERILGHYYPGAEVRRLY